MRTRYENWQQCLNKSVEAARERPFSWGEHDCCCFAATVVEAMTGEDPMADLRGTYADEQGAKLALKERANGTLYRTLQKRFGQPITPAWARRGDLVYANGAQGPSVGVCLGEQSAFVGIHQTQDGDVVGEGIVLTPTLQCLKAFRV